MLPLWSFTHIHMPFDIFNNNNSIINNNTNSKNKTKRVKRFILNPKAYIPANAPTIDTGTAIKGIIVALQFCKNRKIIKITKIRASTNVFTTSSIDAVIKSVLS